MCDRTVLHGQQSQVLLAILAAEDAAWLFLSQLQWPLGAQVGVPGEMFHYEVV